MTKLDTINSRIIKIIDECCGGNRSEFARRIEVTPTYAAQLYKGERVPSERIISSICREFDIRREWLETGNGYMKIPAQDGDTLEYINALTADSRSPFAALIREALIAYTEADPRDRPILDKWAEQILNSRNNQQKE